MIVAFDGTPAITTEEVPTSEGVLRSTAIVPDPAVAGPETAPPVATNGTEGPNEHIEATEGEIVTAPGVPATFTLVVVVLTQPLTSV